MRPTLNEENLFKALFQGPNAPHGSLNDLKTAALMLAGKLKRLREAQKEARELQDWFQALMQNSRGWGFDPSDRLETTEEDMAEVARDLKEAFFDRSFLES